MKRKEEKNDDEELTGWPCKRGIIDYILVIITLIILVTVFREQIIWVLWKIFRKILAGG